MPLRDPEFAGSQLPPYERAVGSEVAPFTGAQEQGGARLVVAELEQQVPDFRVH